MIKNISVEDKHARFIREEARRMKNCKEGYSGSVEPKLLQANSVVCHLYHKRDHQPTQCWALKRKQKSEDNGRGNRFPKNQREQNDDHAFSATTIRDAQSATRYIDSGA